MPADVGCISSTVRFSRPFHRRANRRSQTLCHEYTADNNRRSPRFQILGHDKSKLISEERSSDRLLVREHRKEKIDLAEHSSRTNMKSNKSTAGEEGANNLTYVPLSPVQPRVGHCERYEKHIRTRCRGQNRASAVKRSNT